jgi:hypothetical protein
MQGNGRARVLFVQRLKPDQNIDPTPARSCVVRSVLTRCDGLRTVKTLDMSAL